ncbi:MAG: CoA transferase [Chloroflexi bacterium]|nr:CoA transferase [Chloroflexota bacterium]
MSAPEPITGPLAGVRVLELGSLIAGPFCGRVLAEFGADVIKVEPPGVGDPLRTWSMLTEHGSLWSMVQSRNKRSVSINLRTPQGRELVRGLTDHCDILIENFRPGRLEQWGLGYEDLSKDHPALVMVRFSGFGQTGPYSQRPGFGNIAEAMGGIRYITGWPDRPPLRVGLSLGDGIAALYGVIGTLLALHTARETGRGQVVDVALSESVFSMLESILPEYGHFGQVRERSGNILGGAAPSNTYLTGDQRWLAIGANSDSIFRRLCTAMGQSDLARDQRFVSNQARRQHVNALDAIIAEWTASLPLAEVMRALEEADVPAGPVYSISDILSDQQYQARAMLEDVPDSRLGSIVMPGVLPRLSRTPGQIRWPGPDLGAHTVEVLTSLLQKGEAELDELGRQGVI